MLRNMLPQCLTLGKVSYCELHILDCNCHLNIKTWIFLKIYMMLQSSTCFMGIGSLQEILDFQDFIRAPYLTFETAHAVFQRGPMMKTKVLVTLVKKQLHHLFLFKVVSKHLLLKIFCFSWVEFCLQSLSIWTSTSISAICPFLIRMKCCKKIFVLAIDNMVFAEKLLTHNIFQGKKLQLFAGLLIAVFSNIHECHYLEAPSFSN